MTSPKPAALPLDIAPPVAAVLAAGRAVVALESTIISHGMPYPANLETALAVEAEVAASGAVAATIAVVAGRIRVGLDRAALDALAQAKGVVKASGRDLAAVVARGGTAGTTVSATMVIAHLAGIRIFATGGVGGVHRGAEESFDISADLVELGRTPVAVVCAGVKSILDIPKTLEVLETQRVPVLTVGSDDFPAFYLPSSGEPADHRFDTAEEVARVVDLHFALGTGTGMLVANPVPAELAADADEIGAAIARALAEADEKGIHRKAVTPFLLARIAELTDGRSLAANIALVRNNARLAGRIAVALAQG
jgi:pseudouridine-5'-phosphate glycosidase